MGIKKSKSFKASQSNIGPPKRQSLQPLDVDFELIEYEFKRLDDLIKSTEKLLHLSFDSFCQNLSKYFGDIDLNKIIREQRNIMVDQLMKSERLLSFRVSSATLAEFLFKEYYAKLYPEWSIFEKLKYYELFNRFESVDMSPAIENNECYNYIIVPLSRHRFFICLGLFFKRSFLKIADNLGRELRRRDIDKSYYYRQFVAYGQLIVGLYEVFLYVLRFSYSEDLFELIKLPDHILRYVFSEFKIIL